MSKIFQDLTGFDHVDENNRHDLDEDSDLEFESLCEIIEEECNAELIDEIDQQLINSQIEYSAFPSKKTGNATVLSSFEKRKLKKKRKLKRAKPKSLKLIITEPNNNIITSPTRNTPISPFPNQENFRYLPNEVEECKLIDITPSNYPSNLTHVSHCRENESDRIFMFGSCTTEKTVSTHLISFRIGDSQIINLKQQHLEKFPKHALPTFSHTSVIKMVKGYYQSFLLIYSKDSFYSSQIDSKANLITPFTKLNILNNGNPIECYATCYKDNECSEIFRFGGSYKKTQELTNDLVSLSIIDRDHFKAEKIQTKSSTIPIPRKDHCMCFHHENIFIFGGVNKEGNLLNDLWSFDFKKNAWKEIRTDLKLPSVRNCKMISIAGGIQLSGGVLPDGSVNSLIISVTGHNKQVKIIRSSTCIPIHDTLRDSSKFILFGKDSLLKVIAKKECNNFTTEMLTNQSIHDVVFETSDGNRVSANRFYLSLRSKFFESLLNNNQNEYQLEGLQHDSLRFYINYLYTERPDITILPRPVDAKLINILEFDQNKTLRNYITGEGVTISEINNITNSISRDIEKLYTMSIQSKNQHKSTMKSSSLICLQLIDGDSNTDHYFVERAFVRRLQFFRSIIDYGTLECERGIIKLEMSSECCESLIEFMYLNQISSLSDTTLFELLIISRNMLHSDELIDFCESNLKRIMNAMTPEVAVHVIEYFEDTCNELGKLMALCRHYVCSNFDNAREHVANLDFNLKFELNRQYFDFLKKTIRRK